MSDLILVWRRGCYEEDLVILDRDFAVNFSLDYSDFLVILMNFFVIFNEFLVDFYSFELIHVCFYFI